MYWYVDCASTHIIKLCRRIHANVFSLKIDYYYCKQIFKPMMVKAVREIKKGMFPIFRRISMGPQVGLGVAGSGFFVSNDGVFVTTAHIFDGADAQTQFIYYGRLPENLQNPPLQIQELARDNNNDIYIGRIALANTDFLRFSNVVAEVGQTVCIAGYPLARITLNAQGGFELSGVRRYFQPSFILDHGEANADNGQGVIRTHRGFLIRDFGLFGMSGGPVVDIEGRIIGMQASVTDPRESTNGTRTITVENALAINNNRIVEMLEANGIGYAIDATNNTVTEP